MSACYKSAESPGKAEARCTGHLSIYGQWEFRRNLSVRTTHLYSDLYLRMLRRPAVRRVYDTIRLFTYFAGTEPRFDPVHTLDSARRTNTTRHYS